MSVFTSAMRDPYILSSSVTLSYFLFYTAYDKTEKKLVSKNLVDLVCLNRGWDWTLKEINKAMSLSGITCMALAFMPELEFMRKDLLWISMNYLWTHSIYSYYAFYQLSPMKVWKDKAIKRLSIVLGSAAQIALSLGFWGQITPSALVLSATTLSLGHFWTMEVDYKYKLQVRPYAYLVFPVSAYALYKFYAPK